MTRSTSLTSRLLAVAGLAALAGSAGLTGMATATPAAAPARAVEPDLRGLLAGKDGSVVPKVENSVDKMLVDSQLSAIHAAPAGRGVSARLAAGKQAAALPTATGALTGTSA